MKNKYKEEKSNKNYWTMEEKIGLLVSVIVSIITSVLMCIYLMK